MKPKTTEHPGLKQQSRLQALTAEEGRFVLSVSDLPSILVEANDAVLAGDLKKARRRLGEKSLVDLRSQLERESTRTDIRFVLAKLLEDVGDWDRAEREYRDILELEPHAQVYDQLSQLLFRRQDRWTEAADLSRRAHETQPDSIDFHLRWALSQISTGAFELGIAEFQRVANDHPEEAGVHATALWFSQYSPDATRHSINAGYRDWARRFLPSNLGRTQHNNIREPERRLRIAYITPAFRRSPVAYPLGILLEGHDRGCVEVFGYGNVAAPDDVTETLQRQCDCYRHVYGQDSEAVADQVVRDQIDILIAVGGIITDHRLDVLARRPAPIQVDYGGLCTTGMPQVDYRFTDAVIDPPEVQDDYTERLVYLSGGMACLQPPAVSPPVGPLLMQQRGHVTFGSCNMIAKISSASLSLWAQVLQAVPQAELVLKFNGGVDAGIQTHFRQRFADLGVAPERIRFLGLLSFQQYLAVFNEMDLLLDTYPYNGCITTQEGLWMGVPTLTLSGDTYVSRVGRSVLARVGLEMFAANSEAEYIEKAQAFAAQPEALASIRTGLRARMLASPLCDPQRVAQELESAYRDMWRYWCSSGDSCD